MSPGRPGNLTARPIGSILPLVPDRLTSTESEPPSRGSLLQKTAAELGLGTMAMAIAALSMALFVYFTT